jgi:DNA topoisomerase-1
MAKYLVIVESPAKAKTIKKFLGKNYKVAASMGHVRDLPKSQLGVDIKRDFKPKYITIRGKGPLLRELKRYARKVDGIFLATDPDREGEAISWHLSQKLGIDKEEKCRIVFHEITKNAVRSAAKNPRKLDKNLIDAQQARRILDRLVGYKLSPLLWKKVKKGLSAGRVQSVAVRLICDREEEIRNFEPEEYWTLTAEFIDKKGGSVFQGKLVKHEGEKIDIKSKEQMDRILKDLENQVFVVEKVKKGKREKKPAPPFTTSSLQQEAYRKLGFTAKKTMLIAQQLYEGLDIKGEGSVGLVTYIRTDSTRIAETAAKEASEYIIKNFGEEYAAKQRRIQKEKGKNIQDAHEAIRPTSIYREPEKIKDSLSKDQYKLYKLIWERFTASQMSSALYDTVSVDIQAAAYTFRAAGSILRFPGFMKVYIEGKDEEDHEEEREIPELQEKQRLDLKGLEPKQHFTQPPSRYTESSLVKTLEEKGIGRPSTYAPIIDTIQKRGYVVKEDRKFKPTELGEIVIELLKDFFPDIIDVDFTAELEDKLDKVEEGKIDWRKVLREFYYPFEEKLKKAEEKMEKIDIEEEVTDEICEKCGRRMVIKHGRYGKFLACPGFPECKNTKPYLTKLGVECPECGGELIIRKSKRGRKFYGCINYPECEFLSWDEPVEERCPECGSLMVKKKNRSKGEYLKCTKTGCGFVKKHKG